MYRTHCGMSIWSKKTDRVVVLEAMLTLWNYLSCSSSLSIIKLHKHYNANNIHQR